MTMNFSVLYHLHTLQSFQLVFFPLACEHILRAVRVLKQPGGHLLMVGIMWNQFCAKCYTVMKFGG